MSEPVTRESQAKERVNDWKMAMFDHQFSPELDTCGTKSALHLYLSEINRTRLLTPEEERMLPRRIKQGDLRARDEMIRSNLRLVVHLAKNYRNRGVPFLDLIAEGNLGLLQAVEKFDPARGCQFSTYSSWWIRRAIKRSLMNSTKPIELPSYMVDLLSKWRRATQKVEGEMRRPPTIEEAAKELGLPLKKAEVVARVALAVSAPLRQLPDEEGLSWSEMLPDERAKDPAEAVFDNHRAKSVEELLNSLDERWAGVLRMRFGLGGHEPMTNKEIGRKIGLTREGVRLIERAALQRISEAISVPV